MSLSVELSAAAETNAEPWQAFAEALPQAVPPADRVIYRGRNQLYTATVGEHEVVIKAFRAPRGLQRLDYARRGTKAERSRQAAEALVAAGLATPEPMMSVVERGAGGLPGRSWYVCEMVEAVQMRTCQFPGRADAAERLYDIGTMVARLHVAGFHHRDLTAGNILMHQSADGWRYPLVDLNRVQRRTLTLRDAVRSLVQLELRPDLRKPCLLGYHSVRPLPLAQAWAWYAEDRQRHERLWYWKKRTRRARRRLQGRTT